MQSTWRRAIPCWSKVAVARGKCGLGMVANMDWQEISECAIKNATIRPGSKNSKIATCSLPPKTQNLSFYFFRWEIHNGSITFLHLAFSPVFRILYKNGFEPIRQKNRSFRFFDGNIQFFFGFRVERSPKGRNVLFLIQQPAVGRAVTCAAGRLG
jgi:hypothetical protein